MEWMGEIRHGDVIGERSHNASDITREIIFDVLAKHK